MHVEHRFAKVIALGWSDGPTSGLVQCDTCARVFRFEPLDYELNSAHDETDLYVFSLAPLPTEAFEQAMLILPGAAEARWPIWCPPWLFPSGADQVAADKRIANILAQAAAPEYVVASTDGLQNIRASRAAPGAEMDHDRDWFEYLGVERSRSLRSA
jgi:hypothetical protein